MKLKQLLNAALNVGNEDYNLLRFVDAIASPSGQRLLDVGCGYGGKMILLADRGFEVVGVDANPDIVTLNVKAGLNCMSVSAFKQERTLFDVMLMSHIIEHFPPSDLLPFMDMYLDRLKPGGYLIITTPLMSPHFFEDFDHVKPYQPTGISMVFGNLNAQVQYYSRNKLELVDLWFRREPYKLLFYSGLHFKKANSRLLALANAVLALLHRMSLGLISQKNGWMGLYRKVQP